VQTVKPGLYTRASCSWDPLEICWSHHDSQDHPLTTKLAESTKAPAGLPRLGQAAPPAGPRRTIRQPLYCPAVGPAPAPSPAPVFRGWTWRSPTGAVHRIDEPSEGRSLGPVSVRGDPCFRVEEVSLRELRALRGSRRFASDTVIRLSTPTKRDMNRLLQFHVWIVRPAMLLKEGSN
jgi:hypothetical protein